MSAPIRRALQLLPSCATTGIGSLPHTQLEMAMQMSLQQDVPVLPQLPTGNPSEFMIASALDAVPGMTYDSDGMATIDLAAWEAGQAALGARVDAALASGRLDELEPSPQALRAWRPFLWEVEHRKLAFAKVQIAGPFTVRWVTRTSAGGAAADVPELDRQVFQLLMARTLAMVRAVRRAGATPIVFLDEPGLYAFQRTNPRHLIHLQEEKLLAVALQREGAIVGIHCCSNTDWPAVMDLGVELLSTDVRLSLDALLNHRAAFERYLETGATLSLGIIPTDFASSYRVADLVESVEASIRATLPTGKTFADVAGRVLLTPACGLAMRSVSDAERIFTELREAQKLLRAAVDADRASTSETDAGPPQPRA